MSRRRGVQGCSGGRETPSPLFMEKPLSTMHPDGQRLAARVGEGRVREEVDGCPGLTLLARTFWGIFQRDITWMQGTRASGSLLRHSSAWESRQGQRPRRLASLPRLSSDV